MKPQASIIPSDNLNSKKNLLGKILGIAFALVIASALLTASSGCAYFEGYEVQDYLKKVGEVQYASDSMLLDLGEDLNALGGELDQLGPTISKLKEKRDLVEETRMELEAIEAPEAAGELRSHLLELYTQGSSILDELAATGDYRLAMEPLIAEYETASKSFSEKVKSASDVAGINACLGEYHTSVTGLRDKAKVLEPPVLSSRSHSRFVENLGTLTEGLSETIAGLETNDTARVEAASQKMAQADGASEELRAQKIMEREADIRDYNARIEQMAALVGLIQQDQLDLHAKYDHE